MAYLQVEDVPAKLPRQLRDLARREGRSIRDLVLEAVTIELGRREFRARLAGRQRVDLGVPAGDLVEDARREREQAPDRSERGP